MTLQGAKLTETKMKRIQEEIKYTGIGFGHTFVHVTPSGGVHYTGEKRKTKALFIELPAGQGQYVVLVFYEYPKGVITHLFETRPGVRSRIESNIEKIVRILRDDD